MISEPSPLDRLLRLEAAIEALQLKEIDHLDDETTKSHATSRHIWPSDELLLTRLLRRSPQVLLAYSADAELTVSEAGGVLLELSRSKSVFQLCELNNGDAVIWPSSYAPPWLYKSPTFSKVFSLPEDSEENSNVVLQRLPLFKPVVRGNKWTLLMAGEFLPKHAQFPEESENENILMRLDALERSTARLLATQEVALRELSTQIKEQQAQINSLLRISTGS